MSKSEEMRHGGKITGDSREDIGDLLKPLPETHLTAPGRTQDKQETQKQSRGWQAGWLVFVPSFSPFDLASAIALVPSLPPAWGLTEH